jgi:hypothetical protein
VDNKLAMDADSVNNAEALPESNDEDESCGSDGDTEYGASDDGSTNNGGLESKNGDNVTAGESALYRVGN